MPLAALALWSRVRKRAAVDGASEIVLGGLPVSLRQRLAWLPGALGWFGAALLVMALARPLAGREESKVLTEGIDIMLVVDVSSSMTKDGLEKGVPNIEVVKEVVTDFVGNRGDDRIGLVTFAALPRTVCPLTLDNLAVRQHLGSVACVRSNGPEDGTGIGAALGHAVRKLMTSDAKSRIVVLLTDGIENQFVIPPEDAAALAREQGVRVYTIGAGLQMASSLFGGVEEVPMPTEMLEAIAADTNGRFFRARSANVLTQVYGEIDKLETTEREDVRYTEYDDLYAWVLAPAAGLLLLELLLRRSVWLEAVA